MFLKYVGIQSYKCILDSGEVRIEPDVTCLLGKNESGKTAFLESLYRLNPIFSGHRSTFNEIFDYPRHIRGTKPLSFANFRPVVATFELEPKEIAELETIFGAGIMASRQVKFSRSYANELFVDLEVNEKAFVEHMIAKPNLAPLRQKVNTVEQLKAKLGQIQPRPPDLDALLQNLQKFNLEDQIRGRLRAKLPKFLFFDEFSTLPSQFSIPKVLTSPPEELTKEEYTARALLKLAEVDAKVFADSDYEARKVMLEAAARMITDEVFNFWSQNASLRIDFDINFQAGPNVHGEPPYLDIRIWDEDHKISLKFNERSKGFIWFFSFLVNFSEILLQDKNVILLLDEPGLGLHPRAQQDLMRFMTERLSEKHQVIFTTHSPFMIEPKELSKVRMVEDRKQQGSKFIAEVSDGFWETLMPVRASMGYQIIQSFTLGTNILLVEHPSDMLYLQSISEYLKTTNRTGLEEGVSIIPLGSFENIALLTSLADQVNKPVILTNVIENKKHDILALAKKQSLDPDRLLLVTDFTATKEADLEDMFEPGFYLTLLRQAGFEIDDSQLPPGTRILDRVAQATGESINKMEPALQLLQSNGGLLINLPEQTLSRFEAMFAKINTFSQAAGAANAEIGSQPIV